MTVGAGWGGRSDSKMITAMKGITSICSSVVLQLCLILRCQLVHANRELSCRDHTFPCCRQSGPGSMPLDPIILQNQALLRSFKEAAQEPIVEEILPGAVQQPVAAVAPLTCCCGKAQHRHSNACGTNGSLLLLHGNTILF